MTTFDDLKRDRKIYRELRKKMSQIEKLWLLDCSGDYRIYLSRLYKLAADHKIETPEK
jgi:hypothetical protein